jgi:dipeptidyl aminopeptidase/acylaminoacyl peptidase
MLMLLFSGVLLPLPAQERSFGFDDLGRIRGISDVELSPDGAQLVYVRGTTDFAADRTMTEMVLVSVATGESRVIAQGRAPRWSPDGRWIAYRGRSAGGPGIVLYDLATGASRGLVDLHETDHFLGRVDKGHAWSPDGKWIAYIGTEPTPSTGTEEGIRVFERILYKTRTGFSDNRTSHIWVVPVKGGEPRMLTSGEYDEHSLSWSPDSKQIVFASNRSSDPDNDHSDDLWTVELASGEVSRLTETVETEYSPAWSPDGRWIAYRGNVRPRNTKDSSAEDSQLFLLGLSDGSSRSLTAAFERRVGALSWDPRGDALYLTAPDHGATHLYRVDSSGGEVRPVTSGAVQVRSFSLDAKGRTLAWIQSSVTQPPEVWVARSDGSRARQLTREHEGLLRDVALQDADSIWFTSFDGTPVQGWIMRPAEVSEGGRVPMILSVHGGPHGMYGWGFSDQFQLLTTAGYAVLFINPRGSTGYGQAFTDGSVLNWGGGDYQDLMAGMDHALARFPWLDADRLGVIGGSYGGFMTNWIVTQTDRFRGAVARASVSNLISFYGTSIYPDLIEVEFNGEPWNNWALLWQWSPLAHVHRATTPTLLLHGENDNDVPFSQGEEMFIALKKLGVETALVRYPGEGHGIQRPVHRLDMHRRTLDWFDRYVKSARTTAAR